MEEVRGMEAVTGERVEGREEGKGSSKVEGREVREDDVKFPRETSTRQRSS